MWKCWRYIYTLKVGLITADEVSMAGGVWNAANSNYYLYTDQAYWTMSPCSAHPGYTSVFPVSSDGKPWNDDVGNTNGVRSVINLKADTQFKAGTNGTKDNPYEVQ